MESMDSYKLPFPQDFFKHEELDSSSVLVLWNISIFLAWWVGNPDVRIPHFWQFNIINVQEILQFPTFVIGIL